jgi:gliding motility-associated-like protein
MKTLSAILFLILSNYLFSQTSTFTVSIVTTNAVCAKGTIKVTATGGSGDLTMNWSNGNQGYYISGLDSGFYTVTISDTTGADTSLTIEIKGIECSIGGAPTFSPNGDGIHDMWSLSNIINYDTYLIQIYDRWGQRVFQSKSNFEAWDGKSQGTNCPDGTYYYVIEYTDVNFGEQKKFGSITLLR